MAENSQVDAWNGESGRAWVEHVEAFDEMLEPFGRAVFDRLPLGSGTRVLDVGCGVGTTTIAIASMVRPGTVVGADLSTEMITAATTRASGVDNVRFVEHNVMTEDFETGSFDVAFSRFGVMFFPDPVRAFSNIARALVADGRFGFVAFRAPVENPCLLVPVSAAAQVVPMPPPPGPNDPSPFSLADPDRIRDILTAAGFIDISIEPGPTTMVLGRSDDIEAVAQRAIEQNPGTSPGFAASAPDVRTRAVAAVVDALTPHCVGDDIALDAATWVVTASKQ